MGPGRPWAAAFERRVPRLGRRAGRVPRGRAGSAERGAQLRQRALLDLTHTLGADPELVAEVAQRPWAVVGREAAAEDAPLPRGERREELAHATDGVAPFGPLARF